MASISAKMIRQSMPTSNTLLYTVPAAKKGAIVHIIGVNRGNAPAKWWLYVVEPGDSPSDENILIPGTDYWDIPTGANIDYHTWVPVAPGAMIYGYSTGSVTLFVGGELRTI